jgi:hypothetical protein
VTARHVPTPPLLERERHGGVFRFGGVPPRDHGPGGRRGYTPPPPPSSHATPPPGRLARRVIDIFSSEFDGSPLAPVCVGGDARSRPALVDEFRRATRDGDIARTINSHGTSKGTA